MINGILILHIIITASLIGLVLIQKSEGGALGMNGGQGGFMSTRGTTNFLTRTTGVLATLFFITTLGLAYLAKGSTQPKSILNIVDADPVPGKVVDSNPPAIETKAPAVESKDPKPSLKENFKDKTPENKTLDKIPSIDTSKDSKPVKKESMT